MLLFFVPIVFRNIFTIPLIIRISRLITAFGILTVVPMAVVNEQRKTPLLA